MRIFKLEFQKIMKKSNALVIGSDILSCELFNYLQ